MKCKHPRPGFELESSIPYLTMVAITPRIPLYIYIYIYIYVCVCVCVCVYCKKKENRKKCAYKCMRKFINNISLSPPTCFDQYKWNYLRYEITEISGGRYFRSSS